jgi:exodeoxyribonuclease V gamma subunit
MADRTIVVHACHGPTREVEVLRDELLGLFNDDPTLLPRHVLVLTPDLETYAPVIDAVFGAAPTGWVPYGFVGRGLVAESPVVEAFLTLVDIAQGRLAASGVLDLLSRDPVRRHFAISEEDLPTLRGWLSAVNIRWGVDAAHRATFDQPQTFETTWRFGFDRMLLGYAMPGADPAGTGRGAPLFAGTLPFDEIEGGHAALLGRFGLFCQRLFDLAANLLTPRTVHDWCAFLTTTIGLFLAASDDDATSLQQLRDTLSSLAADASRFDESIPLAALTPRLGELLAVPGGADDVMSGGITFGPLTTLCRIPARVVVLLGANDGVFPRSSRASTFDLVARNPRRGDPSPRDEDRYAFLEAILSARERLIITYVGQSIRDNATLPPSVVVADLLDLIDRSFVGGRALVWGRQPLQGFSPANFVGPRPSFDAVSFQAAHALVARGAGEKPAGMFSSRLAPVPLGPRLDLEDLIAFFAHPVKALLRGRLGLRLGEEVRDLDNREPMDLTPLDNFTLGTDLLARALAGEDLRKALPSVRASGTLPLGTVGTCRFEDEVEEVLALAAKVRRYTTGERLPPLEVNLEVGGTHLTGWLRNCWSQWQVAPRYGRCAPAFELAVWIRHLAMQTVTGAPRRTVIVARDTKQKPVVRVYAAVEDAPVLLADLVALYDLGQHLPLCFFPDTSRAYAMAELKGDFGLRSARQAWQGWVGMQGEGANPYNARVFRGQDPYEPGYCLVDPEEPSFAELALRIWKPVWRATDGA